MHFPLNKKWKINEATIRMEFSPSRTCTQWWSTIAKKDKNVLRRGNVPDIYHSDVSSRYQRDVFLLNLIIQQIKTFFLHFEGLVRVWESILSIELLYKLQYNRIGVLYSFKQWQRALEGLFTSFSELQSQRVLNIYM